MAHIVQQQLDPHCCFILVLLISFLRSYFVNDEYSFLQTFGEVLIKNYFIHNGVLKGFHNHPK